MDQIPVSFSQIVKAVESIGRLKILVQGKTYFTVEDTMTGYRAYFQVNKFGMADEPKYYRNYEVSTVHKPNKNAGSGTNFKTFRPNSSEHEIVTGIIDAIFQSRKNIESGRVRMDTRIVSECGKYLVEKGTK